MAGAPAAGLPTMGAGAFGGAHLIILRWSGRGGGPAVVARLLLLLLDQRPVQLLSALPWFWALPWPAAAAPRVTCPSSFEALPPGTDSMGILLFRRAAGVHEPNEDDNTGHIILNNIPDTTSLLRYPPDI